VSLASSACDAAAIDALKEQFSPVARREEVERAAARIRLCLDRRPALARLLADQ
jgi:hypothetical protein